MRPLRAVCRLLLLLLLLLVLQVRTLPLLPYELGQSFKPDRQSERTWPLQQERREKPQFRWQESGQPVKSAFTPIFSKPRDQKQQNQPLNHYEDQNGQKEHGFGQNLARQHITPVFSQQTPWPQNPKPQEWPFQHQRPNEWHFQPNYHQYDQDYNQHQQRSWQLQRAEQLSQWGEQPMYGTESNIQKSAGGQMFGQPKQQQPPHPWQFQQKEPQLSQPRVQPLNEAGGQFLGFPAQDFHPAQHNNFWSAPRSPFRGLYHPQNNIVYMPQYNNQPIMMHAHPPSSLHPHTIPEDLVAGRFSPSVGNSEGETPKGVTETVKKEAEEVTTTQTTPSFLPELDQWFKEHAAELEANKTAKEEAESGAKLADFVKKYGPAIYDKLKAVQTATPSQ
uniref:Uncharacterized protein n=1 Tax=Schistocephalus solidus TaxID=70667 RepID=A0A0X3Q4Q7_SCHSO